MRAGERGGDVLPAALCARYRLASASCYTPADAAGCDTHTTLYEKYCRADAIRSGPARHVLLLNTSIDLKNTSTEHNFGKK